MQLDEKLQKELDEISIAKQSVGIKSGQCNRCGEFRALKKTPWEDPYTGTIGIGWLCPDCFPYAHQIRAKITLEGVRFSQRSEVKKFSPVPKPKKKK